MIKVNFIRFVIIFFFITGCGYNPVFSNKEINFSIYELRLNGNNKLNKIINAKLNNYKGSNNQKMFSLQLETKLNKEVASRDTKGNPTTYRINLETDVFIKDKKGNTKNKLFFKSIDYNNNENKSLLKKFENETSKNLAEKISDEIIIYLQSI